MPDAWLALLQALHRSKDRRAAHAALAGLENPDAILAAPERTLREFGFDAEAMRRLRSPEGDLVARWRAWLHQPARRLVTHGSPAYPRRLAEIPDAPLALWALGENLDLLAAPQIAVVGTRHPTTNGRITAEVFAEYLSACGLTVTSGLAIGIDAAAHRGALRACGGTVGVLGSGIDIVYPSCNRPLAAEIVASGLVVSEYAPGTSPLARRFPERNRIIAGLSLGTLVVEAARRSGALITARHANDYGREVFAVPGSIHNPLSRGCHRLLREGAKLVEDGDDVLVELVSQLQNSIPKSKPPSVARAPRCNDPTCAKLLKLVGYAPVNVEDLLIGSGLTAAELSSMLLLLELEGQVEALPGGRYCRLVKRS